LPPQMIPGMAPKKPNSNPQHEQTKDATASRLVRAGGAGREALAGTRGGAGEGEAAMPRCGGVAGIGTRMVA